jgi:hypothetical protein
VLNKIEVSRWGSLGCAAKVWISQVCDGETTVDSFYAFRTEGEVDQQIGWWIRAGWQGPTQQPLESGWLGMVCGTITGIVDYADAETEVSEENNECSVTIGEGQNSVAHTCVEFLENAH